MFMYTVKQNKIDTKFSAY